jgi:DNA-binding MarR family transcriptional regulator
MWYYDAHIYSGVAEYAAKDLKCKSSIVSVICKRLEQKESIGLLFDKGDFDYFETYKGPDNQQTPEPHLLDASADPEEYEKYFKSKI